MSNTNNKEAALGCFSLSPKNYLIGETERFYSRKAATGRHLVGRRRFLSEYVYGEKKDMKYRVEIGPKKGLPAEQIAVYEDCGWEYVCSDRCVHIFRAPRDSDTEEFYLDPAQQAQTLTDLRKDVLRSAFNIPSLWIYMVLGSMLWGRNIFARYYIAFFTNPYSILALIAFSIRAFTAGIVPAIKLTVLYRKLKNGISLDHSRKKTFFTNKSLLPVIFFICIGIILYLPGYSHIETDSVSDYALEISDTGYTGAVLNEESSYDYRYETPLCIFIDKNRRMAVTNHQLYQMIFILDNTENSHNLSKALMKYYETEEKEFTEIKIEGLDKARTDNISKIVAVKGNKVAYISFTDRSITAESMLKAVSEKWSNF